MIREALAGLARQPGVGTVISRAPGGREVVERLVGGETIGDAVAVAGECADEGFWTALEWTGDAVDVRATLDDQVKAMVRAGLASTCEMVLIPERLTTGSDMQDEAILDQVRGLALDAGVSVTLGSAPEVDLARHLELAARWRAEGAPVRVTIPASMRSAEALCRELDDQPIRLVKGFRRDADRESFHQPIEIDKSFIRCAKALLPKSVDPAFATHDARLIEMLEATILRCGREPGDVEFTLFLGRQERLAQRLLRDGHRVRLYIPFGSGWYERLLTGLAEQSSSVGAALRSLLPGA